MNPHFIHSTDKPDGVTIVGLIQKYYPHTDAPMAVIGPRGGNRGKLWRDATGAFMMKLSRQPEAEIDVDGLLDLLKRGFMFSASNCVFQSGIFTQEVAGFVFVYRMRDGSTIRNCSAIIDNPCEVIRFEMRNYMLLDGFPVLRKTSSVDIPDASMLRHTGNPLHIGMMRPQDDQWPHWSHWSDRPYAEHGLTPHRVNEELYLYSVSSDQLAQLSLDHPKIKLQELHHG